MSKVALVTHDVQTLNGQAGGVAAFVTHFARLLKQVGEDVTIILTRQETDPVRVDEKWRSRYADWGIDLIELHNPEPEGERWRAPWAARLSERVAPLLLGFDIAYFQDWANVAFHSARVKRFSRASIPVLVTVLHGVSEWVRTANQAYPDIPDDLHVSYIERYSAKHSDLIVSPSQYMADWVRENGWEFRSAPTVLGLPYLDRNGDLPSSVQHLSQANGLARPSKAELCITRVIFFGRLQTRKGVSLFVAALRSLFQRDPAAFKNVTEILFLGQEQEAGSLEGIRRDLTEIGIRVKHIGDFDSEQAGDYLAAHATDSLIVVPSPVENFPYAVIEASLIPGINLLCSQGGGIPKIFDGQAGDHFFEPHPAGLGEKLAGRLKARSRTENLPPYDADAANSRWLKFHRDALSKSVAPSVPKAASTVDVCIPYFNQQAYLPQLLGVLEHQTSQKFGVIAIDDGSEPVGKESFDLLRQKYCGRRWQFHSQSNSFVDAARNRAASLSNADYLLFIDADDVPALNAVEKMLEAITVSDDDCLVAGGMQFYSQELPYDLESGELKTPILARYMPLGPDLMTALADPMVLGPSMILIRRTAFEKIGGYRTKRGAAHEDWELQIRLLLAGLRVDVLPEYLLYFRKSETGLSRTSSEYEAKRRLIETYENELAKVGLRGAATALISLLKSRDQLRVMLHAEKESNERRLQGLVGEMLRRKVQG